MRNGEARRRQSLELVRLLFGETKPLERRKRDKVNEYHLRGAPNPDGGFIP